MAKPSAIVIGAGIVGLATARALALRGFKVTVIERSERQLGASVRNFGMLWPIGQPDGPLFEKATRSISIWKKICEEAGIWYEQTGSLHVAQSKEELAVLKEMAELRRNKGYILLNAHETTRISPVVVKEKLLGGLFSPLEMIIDPREAMVKLTSWLSEKLGVDFIWNRTVTQIDQLEADEIVLCSGSDFETLYPEIFSSLPLTKCKLQMLKLAAQSTRIGPPVCGGLSLAHYASFQAAPSLPALKEKLKEEYPEYFKWGIHVMVSQNQQGELLVGDSHEYGPTPDPFDKQFIFQLIIDYLRSFVRVRNETIIETWHGVYPKLTNGESTIVLNPEPGVTIINGVGGAGMTLSFAICEDVISLNTNLTSVPHTH